MATTYVRNPNTGNFELVGPGGATTDTTLSQTGKPADAAAVGNALSGYSQVTHEHTNYAQLSHSHDDYAETVHVHTEYASKNMVYNLGAYNLLDNSNFANPVNQRGNTSYNTEGYTIDRWKISSGSTVTVNDGNVTVTGSMTQYIEGLLASKTYTFAYGDDSNTVIGNVSYDSTTGYHSVTVPAGTWTWAVLYDGEYTLSNLPLYIAKGHAIELLECKRYLQVLPCNHTLFFGTSGSADGTGARLFVPLTIPMRVEDPEVAVFTVNISTHDGFIKQTTFTKTVARANGTLLSLYGNFADVVSETEYVLIGAHLRNENLIVSAEL